jgi:transcription factor 1
MGEQFAAQIFRCIPEHEWLFKFGRVPLNLILSGNLWGVRTPFPPQPPSPILTHLKQQRVQNPVDSRTRCKLTVIADATSATSVAIPPKEMLPYDDHFHPTIPKHSILATIPDNKRAGTPFVAIDIKPLEKQV